MSDLQCPATVLIARHAEATYPTELWSDAGGTLTELGRRQAAELAERLRPRRIGHVYPSTMERSVQTAEIVAERLGVGFTPLAGLREFEVGDGAGRPLDTDPFQPTFTRWLAGEHAAVMPGAETGTAVLERIRDALQQISDENRGETVLAISHGGVMRFALPVLDGHRCRPGRLANTAVVEFEIDNDDWVCRAWPPDA
ncbi:histidine phosphatase family protein [Nakamurella lactea]|uniref:histidine phosphatase family protein n=1 Tax=Nakamurella lactea TaxID=459515 RepID=UPI0004006CB4|nr:histidine phosphatase family protein [Nakamurella lactea]